MAQLHLVLASFSCQSYAGCLLFLTNSFGKITKIHVICLFGPEISVQLELDCEIDSCIAGSLDYVSST